MQAVIVEGKDDKVVLENIIDATIIFVNGFGIYRNKTKLELIKKYAKNNGVIIFTDSDNAGRQIRNYLNDLLLGCEVSHLYAPNLHEVEDTAPNILRELFEKYAAPREYCNKIASITRIVTREMLFDDGYIGKNNSSKRRKELLIYLDLPENLSVTALLDYLNNCGGAELYLSIKED